MKTCLWFSVIGLFWFSIPSATFKTRLSFIKLARLETEEDVFTLPSCDCICLCIIEFMRLFICSFNCLFFFNLGPHYKRFHLGPKAYQFIFYCLSLKLCFEVQLCSLKIIIWNNMRSHCFFSSGNIDGETKDWQSLQVTSSRTKPNSGYTAAWICENPWSIAHVFLRGC